ncbi:hypothetical protein MG293_003325 [Ovis ammon polii]|uniref:Myelin and lymphocyte protein n=1 Tax=Ovis ammon polii TaxID=230172 RepID=A0AAD4UND0_OVIAM|nr:hypothetical protein MG293_003325 [Ovis ammon polii]
MAPSAASGVSSLPSGFAVFTTFPDLLFIFEFVFGGLVWILVSSSHVPIPLIQGWVMFASVFCFVATTVLAFLYVIGAHGNRTSWITLDAAYHCVAALFYFGASVLEALVTIELQDGFFYKYYHENISAVVSGGLVWILILLTQVPVPLVQGWVLFVSVSCFVVTTLLLFLYTVGAHKNWNFWITLDTAYHCLAALFYFSASALETLVTIGLQDDIYRHYSENISAVQPKNAGAVITPISQTGDQGPESLHNPPRGDQELEGPGVQAKCFVTHTLSTSLPVV